MNKGDYTITKSSYTYYLNTKADKTVAYGPGLLHDNCLNTETLFVIQAKNMENKNRESGNDRFVVHIKRLEDGEKVPTLEEILERERKLKGGQQQQQQAELQSPTRSPNKKGGALPGAENQSPIKLQQVSPTKKPQGSQQSLNNLENPDGFNEEDLQAEENLEQLRQIESQIIDNQDGSYHVKYTVDEPCSVLIDVRYIDEKGVPQPIRGVPFVASFGLDNDPKNNELTGPMVIDYIQRTIRELQTFIESAKENIDVR